MSEVKASDELRRLADFMDGQTRLHLSKHSECDELSKEITNLKKQIELLEKSNDYFCEWDSPVGWHARKIKQQLKELREGSEK